MLVGLLAIGCLSDHLDAWLRGQERPQPLPEQRLVVHEEHADAVLRHAGTTTSSVNPSPGALRTAICPPSSATRSRTPSSPNPAWPFARTSSTPLPSSETLSRTSPSGPYTSDTVACA